MSDHVSATSVHKTLETALAEKSNSLLSSKGLSYFQEGAGAENKLSKRQSQLMKMIKDCKGEAGESRGALAQRMMAHLPEEKKAEYKRLANASKVEFRKQWNAEMEKELNNLNITQEWQKIDLTEGEYMSASRVFQMEGGTEADVQPTLKLLTKSLKMGWPFTLWNEATERLDYLHIRKGFKEHLGRSWKIFSEGGNDDGNDGDDDNHGKDGEDGKCGKGGEGTQVDGAQKPRGNKRKAITDNSLKAVMPAGKHAKTPANTAAAANGAADPPLTDLKKAFVVAMKAKQDQNNSLAAAASMLEEIEKNEEEWEFALGRRRTDLKTCVKNLKDASTSFSRHICSMEIADLKKLYKEPELMTLCRNYITTQGPLAAKVFQEVTKINNMAAVCNANKESRSSVSV